MFNESASDPYERVDVSRVALDSAEIIVRLHVPWNGGGDSIVIRISMAMCIRTHPRPLCQQA